MCVSYINTHTDSHTSANHAHFYEVCLCAVCNPDCAALVTLCSYLQGLAESIQRLSANANMASVMSHWRWRACRNYGDYLGRIH